MHEPDQKAELLRMDTPKHLNPQTLKLAEVLAQMHYPYAHRVVG